MIELPEAGLSRAARWCLVLDFLLLAFLMLWVSWRRDPYEQGPRVELAVAGIPDFDLRALDTFACAEIGPVDLASDSVRAVVVPRPR